MARERVGLALSDNWCPDRKVGDVEKLNAGLYLWQRHFGLLRKESCFNDE
jgi:hypothetical protein